jgi:hypothetical protein
MVNKNLLILCVGIATITGLVHMDYRRRTAKMQSTQKLEQKPASQKPVDVTKKIVPRHREPVIRE